jgi:hypothetical protein
MSAAIPYVVVIVLFALAIWLALTAPPHNWGGLPLSGDKQRYRYADQNQKSCKGRHNAYLFKDGHDPPPNANKNNGRSRQGLLSDCRHRGPKFLVLAEIGHSANSK